MISKPITRFVTLDKPFDIAAVFAKRKTPKRVMVMMVPQYETKNSTKKKTKFESAMDRFNNKE